MAGRDAQEPREDRDVDRLDRVAAWAEDVEAPSPVRHHGRLVVPDDHLVAEPEVERTPFRDAVDERAAVVVPLEPLGCSRHTTSLSAGSYRRKKRFRSRVRMTLMRRLVASGK